MNATNSFDNDFSGHRTRLRIRYANNNDLNETEILELLLTYAIPRVDVRPIAEKLIEKYRNINSILKVNTDDLQQIYGLGENAALFLNLIGDLLDRKKDKSKFINQKSKEMEQPKLINVELELSPLFKEKLSSKEPEMRSFVDDEVANSLRFLPDAIRYTDIKNFKNYLVSQLPYNSEQTRSRRADYILNRFFITGTLDTPLTFFSSHISEDHGLKDVVFYELLQAEPLPARIAEDLIWPSLPLGKVDREQIIEKIQILLPKIGSASQKKIIHALSNVYALLDIANVNGESFSYRTRSGTLASFLYILTSEFPQPGMYELSKLENGPMRKWLLWDWDWIKDQLYNLRDLNIITTISNVEYVQQFNLPFHQMEALKMYFDHPERNSRTIRDT